MIHILLPAYNEGPALGHVLGGIERSLNSGGFQVWVVDDGSTDDTAAVAREWSARLPLVLIRHEKNAGLGKAFQTGLSNVAPKLAPSDVLVTLDSDNTHPTELIPVLAAAIEKGEADIAIASRFARGGETVGVPLLRQVTSLGARFLYSAILRISQVRDYTCGFRAYRGSFILRGMEKWGNLVTESGFAATLEWLVKLSVFSPRIVEVPLVLRYDLKPTPSKMPVLKTIERSLKLLVRMRRLRKS